MLSCQKCVWCSPNDSLKYQQCWWKLIRKVVFNRVLKTFGKWIWLKIARLLCVKRKVHISRALMIIINLHKNELSQQDTDDDDRAPNEAQKLVFRVSLAKYILNGINVFGKAPKISPQIWISLRKSNSPLHFKSITMNFSLAFDRFTKVNFHEWTTNIWAEKRIHNRIPCCVSVSRLIPPIIYSSLHVQYDKNNTIPNCRMGVFWIIMINIIYTFRTFPFQLMLFMNCLQRKQYFVRFIFIHPLKWTNSFGLREKCPRLRLNEWLKIPINENVWVRINN